MASAIPTLNVTPKQEGFSHSFIANGGNATQAYKDNYACSRMKLATINRNAHALLQNNKVATRIQHLREQAQKAAAVTIERVVAEYAKLAFSDMGTYVKYNKNGVTLIASDDLPQGAMVAIQEVSETLTQSSRTVRFKLHDKKGALDALAKFLGMDVERPPDTNIRIIFERAPNGHKVIEGESRILDE